MNLFVDLDGVLADFDTHHQNIFNWRPRKVDDNVDWAAVRAVPNFYLDMPMLTDAPALWGYISHHNPTVLTGVPAFVEEASENKRAWVRKNLGENVPVITCRSSEKWQHASPGDVLIDDWEKYQKRWLKAGGIWITHVDAYTTISKLWKLGF